MNSGATIVFADSAGAGSYPRSAARQIARVCNGVPRGRRSDLKNPQLRLEEGH